MGDDGEGSGISRIDQSTNTVINISTGSPNGIAIDPFNTYLWITTNFGVFRMEVATNNFSGPITVGTYPQAIAISPDNSTVWVTNNYDNTVAYINVAAFEVSGSIPVGSFPTQLVISNDSFTIYVLNRRDSSISVIQNYIVVNTYTPGSFSNNLALSPDNSTLWITYADSDTPNSGVYVINSATGDLIATISLVGANANAIAISPDYSSVWVIQNAFNNVIQIDTLTYATIATFSVGANPFSIAINPDNSAVFITNINSNTVTKLYTPGPPPNFLVEGLPISNGGTALLTLTVIHGRAVDLTSYVQATDRSPLTFTLPLNLGGSVEINGSILTAFQTTPYLPITVTTPSSCTQEPGSMILNIILTVPAFVTPKESSYTLSKVTACPIYTLNQIPLSSSACPFTVGPNQGTFTPFPTPAGPLNPYPYVTTPPGALHQYRSVPRIRGIDQIATVVRGQSSSEATTRRQTATLRGNVAPTTTFFRKPLPPPPCITRLVPQPPYPRLPPCRTKPL